jgi:large subunit ribosomal protein L3
MASEVSQVGFYRFAPEHDMMNTLLGSKGNSSQTFVEGFKIPVTKITAGPCVVTQVKSMNTDGYWAIQLGFGNKPSKNTSKPLQGHLKKANNQQPTANSYPRFLREVRLDKEPTQKVGDVVTVTDIFKAGDVVSVSAVSKGKGFAGVVKRHGFRGGPRTHGQSDRERAPGSIGQTTTPGRVYKGKRMAGRMGGELVTIKNLHIISVNKETNEVEVSGQIPGAPGSLITLHKIKSGKLSDLEHEVVAQVVEGAADAGSSGEPKEENKSDVEIK